MNTGSKNWASNIRCDMFMIYTNKLAETRKETYLVERKEKKKKRKKSGGQAV